MSFTFRNRMLFAFGIVLLATLAVVLISASNVLRVHHDLGLIYFQEIQPLKSVESAHSQILHYDLSIRSHILAGDDIEMKKHRQLADMQSAQAIIELEAFHKIHTSDEEQKLLQDFDRSWAEYQAGTQKAMNLSEQGEKSKAAALLETTRPVFSKIEANLSALANYNELESQKFYEDEAASRQRVEWMIAMLIGIIAAGGLGAFTMMHDAVEREALVASNRMYQMLSQANQTLAQSQEEGTLLNDICHIIHEIGGYKMVWAGYVDPLSPQGVIPSAQIGFPKEYVWVCLDCEECNSPAARAIRMGKPVVARNIPGDPSYQHWHGPTQLADFQSAAALPLIHNGSLLAVLVIYSETHHSFHESELSLLMGLANNLAFGLSALRSKQELRNNERKLRAILDHHFQLTGLLDSQGRQLIANNAALNMADVSMDAIAGIPFWEGPWWRHSPEQQAVMQDAFDRLKANEGQPLRLETSHVDGQGQLHNIDFCMTPVLDQTGQIAFVVLEGHDITDRKRYEAEIDQQRQILQTVLDQMPAGIFLCDAKTRQLLLTNRYATNLLGADLPQSFEASPSRYASLYRAGTNEIYPLEEIPIFTGLKGDVSHLDDMEFRRSNGARISLEVFSAPVHDSAGTVTASITIFQDISERKQNERALQESILRLQRLVEALPVGLHFYHLDEAGQLLFEGYNPAADRILHCDHSQVVGKTIETAFPGLVQTCVPEIYRKIADRGGVWHEPQITYREGEIAGAYDVIAFQSEPNCIAAIFLDITDRQRSEETIQIQFRQLTLLRKIDQIIIDNDRLQPTAANLIGPIADAFSADAAELLIFDPNTKTLRHIAGKGFQTPGIQHAKPLASADYAGLALQQQRMVCIQDVEGPSNVILPESSFFRQEGFRACCAIPLFTSAHPQGVLQLFFRKPQGDNSRTKEFLLVVANQAAIAIEKAILWEQLQKSLSDLVAAYETTLEGWVKALNMRDKETEQHTRRVVDMTLRIARAMGLKESDLPHIQRGALLHDIGKMGIPDSILNKPGPLNNAEMAIMRRHPTLAYELLLSIDFLKLAIDIPYFHHERWDGWGYPRGLKGNAIPLTARIFAVVDVWDALTSDRPYRKALSRVDALNYIRSQSGEQFDPKVVEVFLRLLHEQHMDED